VPSRRTGTEKDSGTAWLVHTVAQLAVTWGGSAVIGLRRSPSGPAAAAIA